MAHRTWYSGGYLTACLSIFQHFRSFSLSIHCSFTLKILSFDHLHLQELPNGRATILRQCHLEVIYHQSSAPRQPYAPDLPTTMADTILRAQQVQQISQDKQNVYERHALRPNSNTIRLLDVQPVPRNAIEGTPLKCTLQVISLDREHDFTALSYVWGDPREKRSILCDSALFEVTTNCYSALWHLSKKLQGLVVWVDAICIDQEDKNKEKSRQLPLMEQIYTKARKVYVWLGEGDKRSDQVMRFMSRGGLRIYVQSAPDEPPRYRPYAAALRSSFAGWSFGYHPLPFRRKLHPTS